MDAGYPFERDSMRDEPAVSIRVLVFSVHEPERGWHLVGTLEVGIRAFCQSIEKSTYRGRRSSLEQRLGVWY